VTDDAHPRPDDADSAQRAGAAQRSAPDANEESASTPVTSRRGFLRAGGLGLAGLVVGGAAGVAAGAAIGHSRGLEEGRDEFVAENVDRVPGFEHIVVLMGENRSFDNMLGWLYTRDTLPRGASFEGLAFGSYSNTAPDGRVVPAHVYAGETDTVMGRPNPDPGEEFPHVNTQLFGTVDPAGNAKLYAEQMEHPFNAPSAGEKPTMGGFVKDYHINYERLFHGASPDAAQGDQIMGGFSPEMLPVLSTLAREFAVFDHWHAAVPSQTYCNRSFFHASTSHGFVTNKGGGGYDKWLSAEPAPTIFNRLEDAGRTWRVYFDELQLISMTGMIHTPVLEQYWRTERFATMDQFYKDAREGTLPDYAFIEPRMVYNHNDFHPPFGSLHESTVDGELVANSAISDVRAGEALVNSVYTAIKASDTAKGSNALNTLLLITFDEHGGTYDHVPPPAATPPHAGAPAGEMGFTFDRLGVRVPAIAISAYTRAGTVVNEPMHHGSVIATLTRQHGLVPLTARDAAANTLDHVVNLERPRDPRTWPTPTPQYLPPNPQADAPHPGNAHKDKPLSPPGSGLVGLLLARYGTPAEQARGAETYADAYEALHKYGEGLFGVQR
jgi:phospholipase C